MYSTRVEPSFFLRNRKSWSLLFLQSLYMQSLLLWSQQISAIYTSPVQGCWATSSHAYYTSMFPYQKALGAPPSRGWIGDWLPWILCQVFLVQALQGVHKDSLYHCVQSPPITWTLCACLYASVHFHHWLSSWLGWEFLHQWLGCLKRMASATVLCLCALILGPHKCGGKPPVCFGGHSVCLSNHAVQEVKEGGFLVILLCTHWFLALASWFWYHWIYFSEWFRQKQIPDESPQFVMGPKNGTTAAKMKFYK